MSRKKIKNEKIKIELPTKSNTKKQVSKEKVEYKKEAISKETKEEVQEAVEETPEEKIEIKEEPKKKSFFSKIAKEKPKKEKPVDTKKIIKEEWKEVIHKMKSTPQSSDRDEIENIYKQLMEK